MAILAFQKPDKVLKTELTDVFGKFEFRPLEPGFGITVGNTLRRILLSSLDGYAISSIRIDGVNHEFASVEGVTEDVTNIILNLKQVRFKPTVEKVEGETIQERIAIRIEGKEEFVAGDLNDKLSSFTVLNPDLHICTIDSNYSFAIELEINQGRGYVPAQDKQDEINELNWIAIDSIYTPIRNVKYFTENYRVDDRTDFEKLNIEITTDGSICPKLALEEAALIMIKHMSLFSDRNIVESDEDFLSKEEFDEETTKMRKILKRDLKDFDLSVRALNCLQAAEIDTLGELVAMSEDKVSKIRNFGNKSLTELKELLAEMSLEFGMDVSKYKLDKD